MSEHCRSYVGLREIEGYIPWCRHCGVTGALTVDGREAERLSIAHLRDGYSDHHKPFVMVVKMDVLRENIVDVEEERSMRQWWKDKEARLSGQYVPLAPKALSPNGTEGAR